ncbi:MAG: hypothetical protein H0W18_17905 [Acidobacteria bacterium]|nr:hypothetical protein [Acidobacteriota bacterium]
MTSRTLIVALCVVLSFGVVCSQSPDEGDTPDLERGSQAPASVKGRFEEVNIGKFDLVEGIAWPTDAGGTIVYVVSKPIASSLLVSSPCPATMARALAAVRDAGWVEVTLDSAGKSDYFGSGKPYGGSSREKEVGGNYWSSTLRKAEGRVAGDVRHKERGGFEFDLPLSSPKVKEVSENDRMQGRQADASAPSPTEQQLTAAYGAAHAAAMKKDWTALLAAIGFDATQAAAIRALEGIDADLEVFADRFLKPGAAGELEARQGHGAVQGEGANSKGAKFINYYWFAPCQGKLVLYSITENPQ